MISAFVLNEVLLYAENQAELDSFLARHSGTLIGTNAVPDPPAGLGVTLDPKYKTPTEYLVKVDASTFDPQAFPAHAAQIGMGGAFKFSSEKGLRLMALVTQEKANGHKVSPNFIREPHAVLLGSRERPAGGGTFNDAFNAALFPRYGSGGSKANVTAAWQWVQAHGIVRRARVAIIDGGFWLNAAGNPLTVPGDGSDLPTNPVQYDFVGNDYIAGNQNPGACASLCRWHGNGSAGVATGIVNNQAASAGTGGTIADPILLHFDSTARQEHWAIRTATAWGADVINMSFGGNCNQACRIYDRDNNVFADAANAGVVLVASAGNSGIYTGADNFVHPCINDGVICVGALADGGNTPFDNRSPMTPGQGWASNFGPQVDIWAPTNISVMPRPDNQSTPPNATTDQTVTSGNLSTFGGTSASSPFIAGIAAMVKAINPTLNSEQVRNLLRDTGWSDSSDGAVSHYVNALEAVKRASAYALPPDRFEANNNPASATNLSSGQHDDLTLHSGTDVDFYRFSTAGPTVATLNLTYADTLGKTTLANYGLTADVACGDYEQLSYTTQANRKQVMYRLPAGNFVFGLGGTTRPMPYDLGFSLTGAAITPDSYEPNDALAQRSNLGDGGYVKATLHTAADVDYYRFNSRGNFNTMVLSMESGVSVQSADGPLTLDIYDNAGTFYQRVSSASNCSTLANLTLPQGFWTIRVSGNAPGSYWLWMGSKAKQHPVIDMSVLIYLILHPNVPVEFTVTEKEIWFAVENRSDFALQGLNLYTAGLHLRLLTEKGDLIAEGQAQDFNGVQGESLSLAQGRSEPHYLVHITRSLDGGEREEGGKMAAIPAVLEMAVR